MLRENGVRPKIEFITMVEKGHADPWKERVFYYIRFMKTFSDSKPNFTEFLI